MRIDQKLLVKDDHWVIYLKSGSRKLREPGSRKIALFSRKIKWQKDSAIRRAKVSRKITLFSRRKAISFRKNYWSTLIWSSWTILGPLPGYAHNEESEEMREADRAYLMQSSKEDQIVRLKDWGCGIRWLCLDVWIHLEGQSDWWPMWLMSQEVKSLQKNTLESNTQPTQLELLKCLFAARLRGIKLAILLSHALQLGRGWNH